ncbi:MAG: hypothetical protein ACE37J_21605 [Pikeienuella sp.]|uniref:hypothetical protein n=1 Tax=Pikeienuella sp. TaxID=2831957 RepID=UPI00391CD22F
MRREPEAMDGLRGLAALGFALGLWLALTPLGGAAARLGLTADFILLASGFICARAHGAALARGEGVGRFLVSRVMRFLPLNAAVLGLLLLAATLSGPIGAEQGRAFFASLALIEVLVPGAEGWAPGGWLMAAEAQLSALFAAFCLLGLFSGWMGRAALLILAFGAIGARAALPLPPFEDQAARVFAAFMLGALLHAPLASERGRKALRRLKGKLGGRAGGALELWALSSALSFLALAPPGLAPFAPLAFAPALLLSLTRKGAAARALCRPAPQALGRAVWPLVMAPALLAQPAAAFVAAGGERAALALLFATPAAMLLILALAAIFRRYVEAPTQAAMWAWLDRALPAPARR